MANHTYIWAALLILVLDASPIVSSRLSACFRARPWSVGRMRHNYARAEEKSKNMEMPDKPEEVDPVTYVFGRPGEMSSDLQKLGTTPRRLALSLIGAGGLALGANFVGVTDNLLSMSPQSSRSLRLDSLYAIDGLRAYYSPKGDFSMRYPKTWLFDQSVAQAQAYRREMESRQSRQPRSEWWDLDAQQGMTAARGTQSLIPEAAFGPPKGGKYENLSVVKQSVLPVGSLRELLGEPKEALQRLLSSSIAPPGSGKTAEVIRASERTEDGMYQFEYVLSLPNGVRIHTWSLVALRQSPPPQRPQLYTMTLVSPESSALSSTEKLSDIQTLLEGFQLLMS